MQKRKRFRSRKRLLISEMNKQNNSDYILELSNIKMYFPIYKGIFQNKVGAVRAVDGVDIKINRGKTLGLVGESGCGKSTLGRTIVGLYEPTAGAIHFKGVNLSSLNRDERKQVQRDMQMIFQDPFASMNPRLRIRNIVGEPLIVHEQFKRKDLQEKVSNVLKQVGLDSECMNRYPHEFSGGQRQRIAIARSIALNPELIVCDEPVSSLDVSIRSQILNLIKQLQQQFKLTYLFISHDLAVVRHISDQVAVMYLGRILEIADRNAIYKYPLHPYTQGLLNAIPIPNPKLERSRKRVVVEGEIPSPSNPPTGCRFHTRCPRFEKGICDTSEPQLRELKPGHLVACHLVS